ncbi:hypothetical protein CC80DRAFT_507177 [Byssothecium circinans]|uniref:tRNA(Ile)-lysidine synthetase n=1 Tax=Byssothecium circinans TaxID=147558 RepID=A0A6A5TR85_9PLEO|nr:hypothetical protein CC80DRAFT_507177 [Byssothecium circinans]
MTVDKRLKRTHRRIGLAVSGGVDSMALATLYRRGRDSWKEDIFPYFRECHGFIIDHKMRPESTEEAEWVAQQLRLKLGMEATIIPLTWPADANPKRFESDARELRYQALGRACREKHIQWLMVAHHADDQAETIMMRLMKKRFRTGLVGLQRVMPLPGTYGMHGLQGSGDLDRPIGMETDETHKRLIFPCEMVVDKNRVPPKHNVPFEVEKGGIHLLRPLLGFEKSRLIATCEEYGTAWAEDKTNLDPTLTPRNAIRHIIQNHKLPEALSSPALVQLSKNMQERVNAKRAFAENLFNKTKIKLDIQTGSLVVRMPRASALLDRPIRAASNRTLTKENIGQARDHAHIFLTRLVELVSPMEKRNLSALANAVPQVWPELRLDDDTLTRDVLLKKTFCAGGVAWTLAQMVAEGEDEHWRLSRQTLERRKHEALKLVFPPTSSTQTSPTADLSPIETKDSQWRLFDGCWWIRVTNNTDQDITLRFLTPEEENALLGIHAENVGKKSSVKGYHFHSMRAALTQIWPARLRRHVPALFLKKRICAEDQDEARETDAKETDGQKTNADETLIALPTLNDQLGGPPLPFSWEIRYKAIDSGARKTRHLVIPGRIRFPEVEARQVRKVRDASNKATGTASPSMVPDADGGDVFGFLDEDMPLRDLFVGVKALGKEKRVEDRG